jgi:putative redox protein
MSSSSLPAQTGEPDDRSKWIVASADASGFRTELEIAGHTLVADEPAAAGGGGEGPTPYEFLLAALGSCTAMTIRMYASRKQWPLDRVVVRLRDTPVHIKDCLDCETAAVGPRRLDRSIELVGALSDEQRAKLLLIADRCPVKQTLERGIQIRTVE